MSITNDWHLSKLKSIFFVGCLFGYFLLCLTGCQIGYLVNSSYEQLKILNNRIPIADVLKDPTISTDEKHKLELALEIREFAEKKLGLNVKNNYSTYVKLHRPYVSYVVSAAQKWRLEPYLWYFPIIGKAPYKGYFNEDSAKEEADDLRKKNLDVYVRGVAAYSLLGWFSDPVLSSMVSYKDHYFVNTLIHESVHATLFIKNEADFNERFAVFLGNKGMELFYLEKEGPNSTTLELVKNENHDDQVFSDFITHEVKNLEVWYQELPDTDKREEIRENKFRELKNLFIKQVKPQLKTNSWKNFDTWQLNNARLLLFKTYMQDLNDFETLYQLSENNYKTFLDTCKKLEKHKNPVLGLKDLIIERKKYLKN